MEHWNFPETVSKNMNLVMDKSSTNKFQSFHVKISNFLVKGFGLKYYTCITTYIMVDTVRRYYGCNTFCGFKRFLFE